MKEMTPMMIEECHKIIKQKESESSQKNNKDMELYHEEVHNSNSLEKNNEWFLEGIKLNCSIT